MTEDSNQRNNRIKYSLLPIHTLNKVWVSHIKPNAYPMHLCTNSDDPRTRLVPSPRKQFALPSAVIKMPSPPCSPTPKPKPAVLFLFGELRLNDPLLGHIFYFLYQTTAFIQGLDVISTANTSTNNEYIWDRPPPRAFLQCGL